MATLTPDGPGFRPKDNKYQPAKLGDRSREGQADKSVSGHLGKFNMKGKSVAHGSDYHDFSPTSGLDGEFQNKDENTAYLRERGKEGQTVRNFSGGNLVAKVSTDNHGATAYNSSPIAEVYKPATGQNFGRIKHPVDAVGEASADPVVHKVVKKSQEA